MYRQGVGQRRRLQIDVQAAVQVGDNLAIDRPVAAAIGLESDPPDA
jgi:hypothetical protein